MAQSNAAPVPNEPTNTTEELAVPGDKNAAPGANLAGNELHIPINPYTIGSNRHSPFDETGNPADTLHAGAPKKSKHPSENTKSGPALWVTVLMSLATLFWMTRKQLRRSTMR